MKCYRIKHTDQIINLRLSNIAQRMQYIINEHLWRKYIRTVQFKIKWIIGIEYLTLNYLNII